MYVHVHVYTCTCMYMYISICRCLKTLLLEGNCITSLPPHLGKPNRMIVYTCFINHIIIYSLTTYNYIFIDHIS